MSDQERENESGWAIKIVSAWWAWRRKALTAILLETPKFNCFRHGQDLKATSFGATTDKKQLSAKLTLRWVSLVQERAGATINNRPSKELTKN
jgi:hypothetical protein